jgi:CRISPR system Cascade subunit CasB
MTTETAAEATASTPGTGGPTPTPRDRGLRFSVGATAARLQAEFLGMRSDRQQADARAHLAILRRSAGSEPEREPLAWQSVLDMLDPPLMPDETWERDEPTKSERAAFDALTLFALHMQSRTKSMHVSGRSFGTAMRLLRRDRPSGSIKPRFDALLAARQDRARLTHARSLITLLRAEDIGLDYGLFAQDLRTLMSPKRHGVLLRWGRDFAVIPRREREKEASLASTGDGTSAGTPFTP